MEVSIVELLALFVTIGAENFVKGPVVLLTERVQNFRLDGLPTLIEITHGNLGGLMNLTRYPEQMRENVRRFDVKKATDSWNNIRDLRHTLGQYLLHQNRFGTGEDETIEREEDVRRHVGGKPLLTDLSLAMRTDPLALIRGATEFVTVIYGPAVTFVFPDVKVETYRRSVLHLNLISAVDGSVLNWCEQHVLRELMSEDLLFGKIAEPERMVINFDDHFRDRMGEVERGHIEVFPKLWNLRPYDKTNGEITGVPRLTTAYHKMREETKDWGDYEKLPEEECCSEQSPLCKLPGWECSKSMKVGQRNSRKRWIRVLWAGIRNLLIHAIYVYVYTLYICYSTRDLLIRIKPRGGA